ncbi:MAG: M48 family metalloprotease [Bacteroidales bacterium]|nr:M48 family metalloprotease [Bacteroidales bacterium]
MIPINKTIIRTYLLILALPFTQCTKDSTGLISGEQETDLGRKVDSLITCFSEQFPVLDTAAYHNAYAYIDTMLSEILQSGELQRKNTHDYQIRIIDRDIIHTFAAPGGYIYFYTGLINRLDNGAQFAGIMAHQIAHIDRRHITGNLETIYHIDPLLSVIWYNNSDVLAGITGYLTGESGTPAFSSQQEYEADEFAVKYLADTDYEPRGILYFYIKLDQISESVSNLPFLNIHADPGNRLELIERVWEDLDSPEGDLFSSEYNSFKLLLAGD